MKNFKNIQELKQAFSDLQHAVACGEDIRNGEIIKILLVDMIIRGVAKTAGEVGAWDAQYFKSNLTGLPGRDVIEQTASLVEILQCEGADKPNGRSDYALRNPKHVFDNIPDHLIDPLLPAINLILQ